MKTIETSDRLDRSMDIVIQREIRNFRKEMNERRKEEQEKKAKEQQDFVPTKEK